MLGKELGYLGLDRLRQQGARSVAQHLGERVGGRPWLKQLDDGSIGHGVSLLRWRGGGSNTPTIRRLLPVSPSPTSAYSSCHGDPIITPLTERCPCERFSELAGEAACNQEYAGALQE